MRQRTTILLPSGQGVDPKAIHLRGSALNVSLTDSVIEERATWSLDEIPPELISLLQDVHELHVRWTQQQAYDHFVPLLSRLPAGLHIFYTPLHLKQDENLCPAIHKLFDRGLKCESVSKAFSSPPILSGRFAHAASFQYFANLARLDQLATYLSQEVCTRHLAQGHLHACAEFSRKLSQAVSFEADFDAISRALVLTATWRIDNAVDTAGDIQRSWQVNQLDSDERVEVGVLSSETPDEPEELKLGGFLAVLGDDEKPGATLFSFPSRHHALPSDHHGEFNVSFRQPTGLHPTMTLGFPKTSLHPPRDSCRLHAYLTLPSGLFIDRYQLLDATVLAENNLVALHSLSGAEDLEAPDWAVNQWGSASLFELAVPRESALQVGGRYWDVQIPLHLRYLKALADSTSSYRDLTLPWPIAFWACEAEEGLKMTNNPFDRTNLGFDGLFGPKTMFYHVPPAGQEIVLKVTVPVLSAKHSLLIQNLTLATVMIGFCWVLFSLFAPTRRQLKAGKKQA